MIQFGSKNISEVYFNGKKIKEAYFNGQQVYNSMPTPVGQWQDMIFEVQRQTDMYDYTDSSSGAITHYEWDCVELFLSTGATAVTVTFQGNVKTVPANQTLVPVVFGYAIKWADGSAKPTPTETWSYLNDIDTITVSGDFTAFGYKVAPSKGSPVAEFYAQDCITKIIQWGGSQLVTMNFANKQLLTQIPNEPIPYNENITYLGMSTVTLDGLNGFLEGTSITNIPSNLFSNLPNLTSLKYCFSSITTLYYINEDCMNGCSITDYYGTFADCTNLLTMPTLNGQYFWNVSGLTSGTTDAITHCFYNCTNISNYSSIPTAWK